MSKHHYSVVAADNSVMKVEMGWDAVDQNFYCNIWELKDEEIESGCTAEDPVYTSLATGELNQSLDYYLNVCFSYHADIPDEMVLALLDDQERNAINEERFWN